MYRNAVRSYRKALVIHSITGMVLIAVTYALDKPHWMQNIAHVMAMAWLFGGIIALVVEENKRKARCLQHR